MTKEEFKKQAKRYFDSINPERGEATDDNPCRGVMCSDCMFNHGYDECCEPYDFFEIMEEFEKWVKAHPAITNKEKFEQIFGIKVTLADCPPASAGRHDRFIDCEGFSNCDECRKWWSGHTPRGECGLKYSAP